MFLVTVRTAFFSRRLPAADARQALQTLWMFAGQDFDITVVDACGHEMSIRQLEKLATGPSGDRPAAILVPAAPPDSPPNSDARLG